MAITHHHDAIQKLIHEAIKREAEKQVEEMMPAIRSAMRSSVGKIALSVINQYDISRNGSELIIRVKQHLDTP